MSEPTSKRSTVRRIPDRADYDPATVHAILDEGFVCHLGFVDDGQPYVIPTLYARDGGRLILHGSPASRMLRVLREGAPACVTVTHVDGLVLARSAFHHSINYRSVVILGSAAVVTDPEERLEALRILVEHVMKGRWNDVRRPNESELKQTMVLSMPITEASAKVRTGPPADDEEDYALPIWAGVLPLSLAAGPAVPDARLIDGVPLPDYLAENS